MTTHKRINDDYRITAVNNDRVTVDCYTFEINGNLLVFGDIANVVTTELFVDDPFIYLDSNLEEA